MRTTLQTLVLAMGVTIPRGVGAQRLAGKQTPTLPTTVITAAPPSAPDAGAGGGAATQGATANAPASTPASQGTAAGTANAVPDIVRTRGGGMMRGMIIERVPRERVVILLPTGETRTIEMDDVLYAGPDRSAATAPPPAGSGAAHREGAALPLEMHVVPARAGELHLHRVHGDVSITLTTIWGISTPLDSFGPVCRAPCSFRLAPGRYVFGVSQGMSAAARAGDQPIEVTTSGRLLIDFVDRSSVRTAGYATLITGTITGLALTVAAVASLGSSSGGMPPFPLFFVGGAIAGVAAIVGPVLIGMRDQGSVQYTPDRR